MFSISQKYLIASTLVISTQLSICTEYGQLGMPKILEFLTKDSSGVDEESRKYRKNEDFAFNSFPQPFTYGPYSLWPN